MPTNIFSCGVPNIVSIFILYLRADSHRFLRVRIHIGNIYIQILITNITFFFRLCRATIRVYFLQRGPRRMGSYVVDGFLRLSTTVLGQSLSTMEVHFRRISAI